MKVIATVDNYNIVKDNVNGNTVFWCTYKDSIQLEDITVSLLKYILEHYIKKDYKCYIASKDNKSDDIAINWTYDVGKCIILARENYGHKDLFSVTDMLEDLNWYYKPDDFNILLYNYFVPDDDDYTSTHLKYIEVDNKQKIIRLQ